MRFKSRTELDVTDTTERKEKSIGGVTSQDLKGGKVYDQATIEDILGDIIIEKPPVEIEFISTRG